MLAGCVGKQNPYKEKIAQLQSRPMRLPLDSMGRMQANDHVASCNPSQDCEMRLVVYTDTADCATCVLTNMYRWNGLLKQLEKYGTRFDIESTQRKRMWLSLREL